ncbi:MAG: hypothetical protein ACOY3P_11210 [Planctomycetota bacterium]
MQAVVVRSLVTVALVTWGAVGLALGEAGERTAAFPGAEGAGKYAVGGRHGAIYRVTNLNASGPGSLADAVSQPNRIVVFAVSGIIDLWDAKKGKSRTIQMDQPNITIAGQTAPGEGICLRGGALNVRSSDVIIRHLRSRRGFIVEGDTGDALTAKPIAIASQTEPVNESEEDFARRKEKKLERGKDIFEHEKTENIIFDHLSTSWATDENLSVTGPNYTTVQYCIAAEGLDYSNPKQTPPNHSEGSLWGVSDADGRATLHHTLYAHNRLRNPRAVSGDLPAAVLDFRNNVVYNASELFSHTGHGAIRANWVGNYYKGGPSTPAELQGEMFRFEHNPESRLYASGNFLFGSAEATNDNWRAVRLGKKLPPGAERLMRVDQPFDAVPLPTQSAADAFETVLDEAGATLPSRDAVDLRIIRDVRRGTGRVIERETDLPPDDRWPHYHSLPSPADADTDGIPDHWEEQFGLDPQDPSDGMKIAAGGYANIEHYFNSTDPHGGATPVVFVAARVSRASPGGNQAGVWRVTRTGSTTAPLVVSYRINGTATPDQDYASLPGTVTIPAGTASVEIVLKPTKTTAVASSATARTASEVGSRRAGDKTVVLSLNRSDEAYHVGCPARALVVIVREEM